MNYLISFKMRFVIGVLIAVTMTGCLFNNGGGSGSVSTSSPTGSTGGGTFGNLILKVTNVYPTAQGAAWAAPDSLFDTTGRLYIMGKSLSVAGTCSRGIHSIQVSSNGSYFSESALCDSFGNFTWSHDFSAGAESDYTLVVTPFDRSGREYSASAVTKLVRIDDSAPAAPTILVPASGGSYTATGANTITVSGTCSADTVSITGPNNSKITPSGNAWSTTIDLNPGTVTVYNFYAFDLAGNSSAAGSISITFNPAILLKITEAIPSITVVTDSSTGYQIETTINNKRSYVSDSNTGYLLETGFNLIVNQVRTDP